MSPSLLSARPLRPSSPQTIVPFLRTLNPNALFCTSTVSEDPAATAAAEADIPSPEIPVAADSDPSPTRPLRGERQRKAPPMEDRTASLICHMMAKRAWTTRLQNSIRSVSPRFDRQLVLDVLRLARHPQQGLDFFRWVEKTGFRHDETTYAVIIRILSEASMLNHARCLLLDHMPKRSVPPNEDMFLPLLEAYGKSGIPQEVVKLFRKMPDLGVERSVRSYDVFFKAILRRGRGMMAKRAFNAMLRDGIVPTLYTYNIMIWGFCLSEMMQTATRFFIEMKNKHILPDVVTYNTLISGWVRANKIDEAEKLFAEMGDVGLLPNVITYTTLIKGYSAAGNLDDGLRLFNEMSLKGRRPSGSTYSVLLPVLCEDVGKVAEARKILDEMSKRRMRPKDEGVFLKMIVGLCGEGRLDEAMEILRMIEKFRFSVKSSHYDVLLQNLCGAGMFPKAVELLDEMLERGTLSVDDMSAVMSSSSYNPIIEYMCGHGQTNKAELFFRQLMKKGVDDAVAFNHLIRGHAREGTPESAVELFAIMDRRQIASVSDAHVLLIDSFLKKGEPADAKTALDGMMERGHLPSSSLFRSVMGSLFDDGRIQTASRVMKSMFEKGITENMDMVNKILEALFMRGHVEEALGRVELMLSNNCVPELDRILVALCDKEKTIAALKLADHALERDCDVRFSTYDRVLETLSNAGKTLNAYSLLCKIKRKGGVFNRKGSAALIKSLNDEGNTKQADILARLIFGDSREKKSSKAVVGAA